MANYDGLLVELENLGRSRAKNHFLSLRATDSPISITPTEGAYRALYRELRSVVYRGFDRKPFKAAFCVGWATCARRLVDGKI